MSRSLWRNRDFLQLWAGETVSLFGSEVTELALPLAATAVYAVVRRADEPRPATRIAWTIAASLAVLAVVNVVGVRESANLNVFLALADFATQLVLVVAGIVLVLSPDTLVNNVHFGTFPALAGTPEQLRDATSVEVVSLEPGETWEAST